MKRWAWLGAALAALAVATAVFWPRDADQRADGDAAAQAEGARTPGTSPRPAASARSTSLAGGALQEAVAQAGAPGSTPPLAQPASEKDGFVEVRVIAQGKALAGAKVRLYLRGRRDRSTSEVDWRFAGAADTGRDGLARIAARPGAYLAAARAPALAPARQEFQRPAAEPVTKVTLELQPGVSLTGTTVQKADKQPVPLATVTLTWGAQLARRTLRVNAPAEEQARATSDSSGHFRFDGLEPGSYRAAAEAAGFSHAAKRVEAPSPEPVVLELAQASFIEGHVVTAEGKPAAGAEVLATSGPQEMVTALASETGSFSVEVSPRTWSLAARLGDQSGRADAPVPVAAGATARGVRIRLDTACGIAGTVVAAASQQPVAGASVAVSPHNANGDSGRAVSDAMGTFAVGGLPPGSYDVAVDADGYSAQELRGVTVDTGQRFPLRVELHQTGAVQGVVRDMAQHGVPYALVQTAQRGFMAGTQAGSLQTRTDDQGNFQLSGVPSGRTMMNAIRDGSTLGASQAVDVPEGGVAKQDFELKDEGVLTGHVRGKDGSPAPPNVTVRAVPSGGGGWRGGGPSNIVIDPTGAYVASVPAGTYSLSTQGSSGQGFTRGPGGTAVTVQAGQTVTQDLVYVAPADVQGFSGTVLEPDGTPSPGAMVRGMNAGRPIFGAMADETGSFTASGVRSNLPETFTVSSANGGRTGTAQVAPQQLTATVQLQPAATVRGVLSSGPEQSFTVSVSPTAGNFGPPGFGGGLGSLQFTGDHFLLTDVPGLPVTISLKTQDGRVAQQQLTLSPGQTQDLQIALQPAATVTGRLVDQTGAPFATFVMLDRSGGATAGADGRFTLHAAAGDHQLTAAGMIKPVTLLAGQTVDVGDLVVRR